MQDKYLDERTKKMLKEAIKEHEQEKWQNASKVSLSILWRILILLLITGVIFEVIDWLK